MARHRAARRAPKPHQPAHSTHQTHRTAHVPSVPVTTRVTAAGSLARADGLPAHAPAAIAGASHAAELAAGAADAGLADVILDLAGADYAGLRQTLTAWQREQDRVLNRAWRRPGGLARPAGL